jgi:hypothetical protein
MSQQIQITGGAKVRNLQDVIIGTSGVLSSVAFDVANGVPRLDVNGKILVAQLPNSVMEYKGTWNAATNTPTLVNGTGNQGDVYLCNVAGTVDFGAGAIAFFVGDQVIYSGSIWQRASGATGTVTSVAITESGDSLNITGSPITTSGTINIGFNGTNLQYVNGAGNLTTFPILTGYVPYTGATANVDLGTFNLTADVITGATGSFTSNGGSDTFAINHSSGAGIALNITKGGSGEGLYINKTSGSGNAATIIGTLNATTLVKSGGTSSQYLMADGSVSTLTNPVTGTGTTNTLPKFTAASTIGNSNITDTGSLITLGSNTTISSGIFRVGSSSIIAFQLYASKNITGGTSAGEVLSDGVTQSDVTNRSQYFATAASTAATSFTLSNLLHFRATQSTFGVGSTVTNQIGFSADATLTGATINYGFQGSIPSGTNRWNLYMDGTANNYMAGSLGIGTTSLGGYTLRLSKSITGGTSLFAIRQDGTVQSDVTSDAVGFRNDLNTAAAAFALTNYFHYYAIQNTIGAGSSITNQYGYAVTSSMTGATNNYGFYGAIASGANRWNLYMSGTANNYLAGSLGIGTTSITTKLSVFTAAGGNTSGFSVGSTNGLLNIWGGASSGVVFDVTNGTLNGSTGTDLLFRQGGTTGMVFAANRRLLIGSTTDNGDTLQVTGTINSTGTITSSSIFIGTSTPTDPTAGINAGTSFALNGNSAGNNYSLGLAATRNSAFDIFFQTGAVNGGGYRWYIGTTERMTLSNTGSLGIGSTSLTGYNVRVGKTLTGSTTMRGIVVDGVVQSDVTGNALGLVSFLGTQASTFTLTNLYQFISAQNTFGAGSTVTNQFGYFADSSLTGATNNYGFYGAIASGTNRWNLYMAGTAANYIAGYVGIGTTIINAPFTPNSTMQIGSTANGFSLLTIGSSTNGSIYFADTTTSTGQYSGYIDYAHTTDTMSFATAAAERFRVNSVGLNIGGNASNNASAKVQIDSTTQGFLPPRVTAAQRTAIATPATGLIVYQTDSVEGLYVYSGASWKSLTMV